MKLSSRQLGIVLGCVCVAACGGGGGGGSSSSGSSSSSGGSSGSSSGGVALGTTPVLDFLLPYASANSTGAISQLTLVNPASFTGATQVLPIDTATSVAKVNYLGTFSTATGITQHTRPNYYYYLSNGSLFGINLHTTIGSAAPQQFGSMTNLSATSVCSINSGSDNLATGHLIFYYSLIGPSGNCAGSDLSSYVIGSDATGSTAPTPVTASGEIVSITAFHSPSTGASTGSVVLEANGELLYDSAGLQNPVTIQAANAAAAPVIVDSNAFRVVLAGPIPGNPSSSGIYTVEASGSVNVLLTQPAGTAYISSVSAPNHTLYAAFGPPPASGGSSSSSGSSGGSSSGAASGTWSVYSIDETKAVAPSVVYTSNDRITAFRAFNSGLITLESVPETATPANLDQVLNYDAYPAGGSSSVPVQIENDGPNAVVTLFNTTGNLLLYNVRLTVLPAGLAGELASTAKIASTATAAVVNTQNPGTAWFGVGEIIDRNLNSDSQGSVIDVNPVFDLQQRSGTDPGADGFYALSASNLAAGTYTGTALGSVDYGSSVYGLSARNATLREYTGLGELAVTYTKGSAALNDVMGYDDVNNIATQITNTPAVNEITY